MKKILAVLLYFAYAFPINGAPIDELDLFIEKARQEWNVPGVAVAIVQDGQIVFKKGFGTTRVKNGNPVDEETIFQLASLTKTFTAAALGIQVDQQKLSWDDELITHLPQFALK